MSKKNEKNYKIEQNKIREQTLSNEQKVNDETIQNTPPFLGWPNFDVFWAMCVKGGTPTIKSACIAHLKAIGAWDDQSKWIEGLRHYGVPVEK